MANTSRGLVRAFVTLVLAALAVSSFASLFALGHLTTAAAANLTALTQGNIFRLARDDKKTPNTLCQPPVELRLARCVSVSDAATKAIQFIRANTGSNEPIFVGTGRHDKIFINDVAFYFIADRPPSTKWYHFNPGLQTSHQIQNIIIADIEKHNTSFVILFTAADDAIEPNRSAISSGVKALDNFISDKYAVVAEFPPYRILKRRMEQSPGTSCSLPKARAGGRMTRRPAISRKKGEKNMSAKKVVVTGAAGLVGQNLVQRMLRKGFDEIVAIDKHKENSAVLPKVASLRESRSSRPRDRRRLGAGIGVLRRLGHRARADWRIGSGRIHQKQCSRD